MSDVLTEFVTDESTRILEHVREMSDEFVDFISALASTESPTDDPESQAGVQEVMGRALDDLGFDVRVLPGKTTGGHLYARRSTNGTGAPAQLMIGHSDTVWPKGTLEAMPVRVEEGRLHGPGTLDMKGGLAQMIFAMRALRDLGHEPTVDPVVFVNSDEEIGSPESRPTVRRLARSVCRTFVLEPSLGVEGLIKTARKGVGTFEVIIRGKAAHAGLEPEAGASAILELSHVIQTLHALNDPALGTTVNVGVIDGGIRTNVVAAQATAQIDVRVATDREGERVSDAIRMIEPVVPGVSLEVSGGIRVPPLERTPRNLRLWGLAREAGAEMGLALDHAMAGGGSDGNTTSLFTATLDGLGCVGDGAHADHEHIEIAPSVDRIALLARLLLAPADTLD